MTCPTLKGAAAEFSFSDQALDADERELRRGNDLGIEADDPLAIAEQVDV